MLLTFLLVVQALIAAGLVTVILMQRSEGGGLGMGGSPSGLMSARGAADFLTRATTTLATLFVLMSIGLAVLIAAQRGGVHTIDTSLARPGGSLDQPLPAAPVPTVPAPTVPLADAPSTPATTAAAPAITDTAPPKPVAALKPEAKAEKAPAKVGSDKPKDAPSAKSAEPKAEIKSESKPAPSATAPASTPAPTGNSGQ